MDGCEEAPELASLFTFLHLRFASDHPAYRHGCRIHVHQDLRRSFPSGSRPGLHFAPPLEKTPPPPPLPLWLSSTPDLPPFAQLLAPKLPRTIWKDLDCLVLGSTSNCGHSRPVLNMAGRPSRKPHEFEVIVLNSLRGGSSDMRQVADRARKYLTSEIDSSREQFRIHHLRQPKFAQSLKNLDDRFKSDRTRKHPGSKRDGKEIRSVIYRLGLQAKARVDAMNSETGWSSTTPKFLDAPKGTLHDLLLAHICKTWKRVCEHSSIMGCTMSISALTVANAIQQTDGRLGDKAKISVDSHVAHGVANEDGEENEDLSAGEDHARCKEEWAWVAFKSRLSPREARISPSRVSLISLLTRDMCSRRARASARARSGI